MRITLLTYGSRGDVEPFVALALGLSRAGHTVRLAGPEVYAGLSGPFGLDYHPLPGDPDRLVSGLVQKAGRNWLGMVRVVSGFVLPLARDVYLSAQQACRDAQLIVHSFLFTNGGHEIAVQKGVPDISAQLFPVFSPTREFPGVTAADLPLGGLYRRLTHTAITQIFWQGSRLIYSRVRHADPQLPPLSGWPFSNHPGRTTPILYAFSPQVVPPPRDWDASRVITGYWFLDAPQDTGPTEKLREFLTAVPAPVYIGFGSTIARNAARLAQVAIEALERSGQRAVLASGRGGLLPERLPSNVYTVESVPHSWLFPQMSAVVHHGGAGTTAAGLRAGVPNILVPFTSDQPFWGRRVERLGVGPKPIPAGRMSAANLAEAIMTALNDTQMRRRASELGARIRAEDGVARAVEFIERSM